MQQDELQRLKEKFKQDMENELSGKPAGQPVRSRQYDQFRKDWQPPHLSLYEKACNLSYKIIKMKPDQKNSQIMLKDIEMAHLQVTPGGVISFSILAPLLFVIFGTVLSFMLVNMIAAVGSPAFFIIFFLVFGVIMMNVLGKLPKFIAANYRLKASNQMVQSVFYVVTYMRHTSNLERAISFAGDHIAPPLSLDFKKILWDVETGKFTSVSKSLDSYLDKWKDYNREFVEAFHLVESSLFVPMEKRRLESLDKALTVILEGTYEKMLHYAQNLKSPITTLYMLGVILPVLGLVILPLITTFISKPPDGTHPYLLAVYMGALYLVALPGTVFFLGKRILASRPTGYGSADITDINPSLKKYKKAIIKFGGKEYFVSPALIAIVVGVVLLLVALAPIIIHSIDRTYDITLMSSSKTGQPIMQFIGYKDWGTSSVGPYGLGASILSVFFPLALGIAAGLYFRMRSKNVMKKRNQAKTIEDEFASALFQLGNRLADGVPAELAFQNVADSMSGTTSAGFFKTIVQNMKFMGVGIEQAIFDEKFGAILSFPSNLVESSMKVLVESARRGPLVASQAMLNMSNYIKQMHKVDERLKDLLSEELSSMKSQIKLMTPVIAGIVIGIASMITTIIGHLTSPDTVAADLGGEAGGLGSLLGFGVPSYYFLFVVGLYVVMLIYILTVIVNGVENGSDSLNEHHLLGKNLIRSTIMFSVITLVVTLVFNYIAGFILQSVG